MLLDKILQSSKPFRDPWTAVEQARGFAKRLVIETDRLSTQRLKRVDRRVKSIARILVPKKFRARNGGDTEAEYSGGAPRCSPLSWCWSSRIGIRGIKAAQDFEYARNVRTCLAKN